MRWGSAWISTKAVNTPSSVDLPPQPSGRAATPCHRGRAAGRPAPASTARGPAGGAGRDRPGGARSGAPGRVRGAARLWSSGIGCLRRRGKGPAATGGTRRVAAVFVACRPARSGTPREASAGTALGQPGRGGAGLRVAAGAGRTDAPSSVLPPPPGCGPSARLGASAAGRARRSSGGMDHPGGRDIDGIRRCRRDAATVARRAAQFNSSDADRGTGTGARARGVASTPGHRLASSPSTATSRSRCALRSSHRPTRSTSPAISRGIGASTGGRATAPSRSWRDASPRLPPGRASAAAHVAPTSRPRRISTPAPSGSVTSTRSARTSWSNLRWRRTAAARRAARSPSDRSRSSTSARSASTDTEGGPAPLTASGPRTSGTIAATTSATVRAVAAEGSGPSTRDRSVPGVRATTSRGWRPLTSLT
jgi:hypothetical protein